MKDETDPRIVYLPKDKAMDARGHVSAIRDAFWCVHPQKGLLFWQTMGKRKGTILGASPQCNRDQRVTELVLGKLYPWAVIEQIPLVLAPIDVSDY